MFIKKIALIFFATSGFLYSMDRSQFADAINSVHRFAVSHETGGVIFFYSDQVTIKEFDRDKNLINVHYMSREDSSIAFPEAYVKIIALKNKLNEEETKKLTSLFQGQEPRYILTFDINSHTP